MTPRLIFNHDSDVTPEVSSVESSCDSDYDESRKNFPTRSARTPELEGHIHGLQKMHEVAKVELGKFTQPMELFTQTDKVDPI